MSSVSDLRGGIDAKVPVGVVAGKLTTLAKIMTLPRYLGRGGSVFIDSGAFSEIRTGNEPDWNSILSTYETVSSLCDDPSRLFVVAPDKVGDQTATLDRLRKYVMRVVNLIDAGCRVIVPLQMGSLPANVMLAQVANILGTDNFVAGIPSNREALSISDCRTLHHHSYHILGRVQMDDDQSMRISALCENSPQATITADANWLRSRIKTIHRETEQLKEERKMLDTWRCFDHPRAEAISRSILADNW